MKTTATEAIMQSNRQFWSCKDHLEIYELQFVHPYLLIVFAGLNAYCFDRGYPAPIITSLARTVEENDLVGAESDSHITMRAFDISSRPYTLKQIEDICDYMKKEFKEYAAVNKEGANRLAVYHKVEGGVMHFHFQIHRRFSLAKWLGLK